MMTIYINGKPVEVTSAVFVVPGPIPHTAELPGELQGVSIIQTATEEMEDFWAKCRRSLIERN